MLELMAVAGAAILIAGLIVLTVSRPKALAISDTASAGEVRPPAGAVSPPCDGLRHIDPLLLLREAADIHAVEARAAGVTVLAPPPGSGFRLQTRPALLTEILNILLANAVRGNRFGGAVLAELRQTSDGLVFRVHDTGPGLTVEARRGLFHSDGAERGLPRAWRLARVLGGRLSAASTPGEGSTFTLSLPTAPATERHASALPAPDPFLASAVLLLIEPDPPFAALMRQVVGRLGAALHVSPSGEEGLTLARDLRPDLIVMEPRLAGLRGFALLTALDADPLTRDIPVVALSADPDPALARKGRRAGFDAWLTKPLDISLFVLTLSRVLSDRGEPRAFDAA